MTRATSGPRRAARAAAALLTVAGALTLAATARADITVTVVTAAGVPVVDTSVEISDAAPGFAASARTDATGKAVITTADLTGNPAPYSAKVSVFDDCRRFPDPGRREATAAGIADGAAVTLTVDALSMCGATTFLPTGTPAATAYVDAPGNRVLATPGGIADLNVLAPSGATNTTISVNGAPLGTAASGDTLRITAPAAPGTGQMVLSYTLNAVPVSHPVGTLVTSAVTPPLQLPGPIDLEAIVDISGSMGGTDPKFIRKDAMSLLVDLMRKGDTLGATAFDDQVTPIFEPVGITGANAQAAALKGTARAKIVNDGGTDYDVGFADAYRALTATPGIDPARQKGVIFLTDGGHNGTYQNTHLLFANTPAGRPWPVCAVQLGPKTAFRPEDVARLKRIAAETGGKYFATDRASDLTDIYNRCFSLNTGQTTISAKTFTFSAGQQKVFKPRLRAGLAQATFFVNWGNGVYALTLVDPRGGRHTITKPGGKAFTFRRGATFGFVRVTKPRAGLWQVLIRNIRLTAPTDRAKAQVTTPRRG